MHILGRLPLVIKFQELATFENRISGQRDFTQFSIVSL